MAKSAAARSIPPTKKKSKARQHLRVVTEEAISRPRWREFVGVALLASSILIGLALLSYHPTVPLAGGGEPAGNLIGPSGELLAELLFAGVGAGAYLLSAGLLLFGVFCFTPKRIQIGGVQVAGLTVALIAASTIAHVSLSSVSDLPYAPGGFVGAICGDTLTHYLATVGTTVLAAAVLAVGVLLATDLSVSGLVGAVNEGAIRLGELASDAVRVQRARLSARAEKRAARRAQLLQAAQAAEAAELEASEKRAARRLKRLEAVQAKADSLAEADLQREELRAALEAERIAEEESASPPDAAANAGDAASAAESGGGADGAGQSSAGSTDTTAPAPLDRAPVADPPWVADLTAHDTIPGCSAEAAGSDDAPAGVEVAGETEAASVSASPKIVEYRPRSKREARKLVEGAADERPQPFGEAFELPPLDLLDYDAPEVEKLDRDALAEESRKLTKKFKDYGIEGHVREIRPGPVVTTYEFVPAAGTRIARIASLADDLAMAMEAIRVRVVAPIPGKGAVGIEIPNDKRQSVYLKEIIASAGFQRTSSKLGMALGKDIEGRPYHVDLAKMPHMLIAGTTGSGKSVAINAMITSILYKATPDEVRFLMIDPKMLELAIYEGIPHLLLPPVTDPKKAAVALRWAVEEMERRYQLMAEHGVRDIVSFNKRIAKSPITAGDATEAPDPTRKRITIRDERDEVDREETGAAAEAPQSLPYIVVVLDEFADLMMVAPRDVESYVARLAQKARACGIHLLLATQRPSTDVITGVIKANFPVRMSFQVASNHDSKTIINGYGAEKLLGKGDMLLIPPGTSTLLRCHGAFISDIEIKRVVDFLKGQGAPHYDESILKAGDDDRAAAEDGDDEYDEHYDAAVAIVAETRQVSISMIQRRLKIGYNRAARIVERMERDGLVGPQPPGNKPREVFVGHIEP